MQQQSMSGKLSSGKKVKCVQAGASECFVGALIESWQSRQRRYTVLVWEPGKGEFMHCGLNGIQAVTPRVRMNDEDGEAMLAAISSLEMTNPKSAYNTTNEALKAARGGGKVEGKGKWKGGKGAPLKGNEQKKGKGEGKGKGTGGKGNPKTATATPS